MIWRFLPLIWKNAWRQKRRSILTALGVAVAVFVFAALDAAIDGMGAPLRAVGAHNLLHVREAARANALVSRLPEAHVGRTASIDGVGAATGILSALAVVGEKRVHIFLHGVDPTEFRAVDPIPLQPESAWDTLATDRTAAVSGRRLLQQMGWKVGQEVELRSLGLRFHLVGEIEETARDLGGFLVIPRKTLQAARAAQGQVSYVLVAPAEGQEPGALAQRIDETFAGRAVPTRTASSERFAEALVRDFAGVLDYLRVVSVLAVLIVVLAAANAMAMSVRERTRELGGLKAMGFTPALVWQLVVMEATLLSVLGGVVGLGAAYVIVGGRSAAMSGLVLEPTTLLVAAGLTLATGVLGGMGPALRAARLQTADALRAIG